MLIGNMWLGPASNAVKWLANFGKDDLRDVKLEINSLLNELWATYRADTELRRQITSLKDDEFKDHFSAYYHHWTDHYFDSEDFSRTRTHCGEIRRRVGSLKFKLVRRGRANLGAWAELDNHFSNLMNVDDFLTEEFENRLKNIQEQIDVVYHLYDDHKKTREDKLAAFRALKSKIKAEEQSFKNDINAMEQATKNIKAKMR